MLLVASLLLLPTSASAVAIMLAEKFMLSMLLASLLLFVSLLLLAFLQLLAFLLLPVVAGILAGIPGVAGVPLTTEVHAVDGGPSSICASSVAHLPLLA
jgi:hypothetical protein